MVFSWLMAGWMVDDVNDGLENYKIYMIFHSQPASKCNVQQGGVRRMATACRALSEMKTTIFLLVFLSFNKWHCVNKHNVDYLQISLPCVVCECMCVCIEGCSFVFPEIERERLQGQP